MKILLIFGKSLSPVIAEQAIYFNPKLMHWNEDFTYPGFAFYIIGFTDYRLRIKLIKHIEKFNITPMSIINNTAYISNLAQIGPGCYIAANASISTNVIIGKHCIINLNASIGHDTVIEDHCIILPGARISGDVHIGEGTLVGSNSFVYQGVKIGRENMIDALTYIRHDLPDRKFSSSFNTKTINRL